MNINSDSAPRVISIKGADRLPRGIISDGGFKLMGTPLAFHGARNPGLLFCAHLDQPIPSSTKRIIGTSFVMGAIRGRKHQMDMLAVDYDRLFRLGRMDLRLLPAGLGPGSAMLEIRYQNRTIVYCGGIRLARPIAGEAVAEVKCDLLLLDVQVSPEKPLAPRTVKKQFVNWVLEGQATQVARAVVCDTRAGMYDVVSSLEAVPFEVHAHRGTYDMLRDTGYLGMGKDHIVRLDRRWPSSGLVLFSKKAWATHKDAPSVQTCFVGVQQGAARGFPFGGGEATRGLIEFTRSTEASAVALSPRCGENAVAAFQKAGLNVFSSKRPVQLPLGL